MVNDYLNFMAPGEKPNADVILKRMKEYDTCLLTGDTENLVSLPVDFNPANILPSNMARISKKYTETAPIIVDYRFNVDLNSCIPVALYFRSTLSFFAHNEQIILNSVNGQNVLSEKQIKFLDTDDFEKKFNGSFFTELFEYLTALHLKGIDKIELLSCFSMDWSAYQAYLMGTLERMKNKSNIIRPNFGL